MAEYFICDEAETTAAKNKCEAYAEFLVRTMHSYTASLLSLQEQGIQDDLVCGKLAKIALDLIPYKLAFSFVDDKLNDAVKKGIRDIETADKFKFPSTNAADILRILSALF